MKHWLGIVALICFGSQQLHAAPYFRLLDPGHPYKVVGAFVDPVAPGQTTAGTALALVTHSTRDGCLLPSVVCEDWAPLTAGLSINAGRVYLNLGPVANLAPIAKAGILGILNLATAPERLQGLKGALAPGEQPVEISFGPNLNEKIIEHGVVLPLNKWQGRFRIFAGAAVRF